MGSYYVSQPIEMVQAIGIEGSEDAEPKFLCETAKSYQVWAGFELIQPGPATVAPAFAERSKGDQLEALPAGRKIHDQSISKRFRPRFRCRCIRAIGSLLSLFLESGVRGGKVFSPCT